MIKSKVEISVRNLVEYVYKEGDIKFDFFGYSRAVAGTKAHQVVQKGRSSEYKAEINVEYFFEATDIEIRINGRMDGVFLCNELTCIDEIKSTTKEPDFISEQDYPIHWAQAKVYAYIYAVQNNLKKISVQLTYVNIYNFRTVEFRKLFDIESLNLFFNELLSEYLDWALEVSSHVNRRNASIAEMDFPFSEYRPGQRALAVDVYRAIAERNHLFVQAPTGIGKTMATIYPALKALGLGLVDKIFYLTAKNVGRMIALESLKILCRSKLECKILLLTAKEKVCLKSDMDCHPDKCEYARNYYQKVKPAVKHIYEHNIFDKELIESVSSTYEICPFEFSLELSVCSDVIICDYNYTFDPRVYLRRFFGENKGDFLFLVDEAHNLVDRARDMFSAEIRKSKFMHLKRKIKKDDPKIHKTLNVINKRFLGIRKKMKAENREFVVSAEPDKDLVASLRNLNRQIEKYIKDCTEDLLKKELLEVFFECFAFLKIYEYYDNDYAVYYEKSGIDVTCKLFCLNPSRLMKENMKRCIAAVFFSATLTPLPYFRYILGGLKGSKCRVLNSPFPIQNLCLMINTTLETYFQKRVLTRNELCNYIRGLISQKKGNYLVFFPSYHYLKMTYEIFKKIEGEWRIIVQESNMTESERTDFLREFISGARETLVGFAVLGGVFGEGIDLVGDKLTGAVIVGVGMPQICLERNLICEYFNRKGKGFDFAYLYPGFNRVMQAVGRVIRSESDRGAVLLLDTRYTRSDYKRLFPREWRFHKTPGTPHEVCSIASKFWKVK